MSDFTYKNGQLHAEDISLLEIAKRHNTPCYIYSKKAIQTKYTEFDLAFTSNQHLICYAVKANSNISILNILAKMGSGFDIVSSGELFRVLKAGGSPDKVVFSGVGKRLDEMKFALEQNIKCFNVESKSELLKLNEIAESMKVSAPVSLRVNPDVDAKTHPYIATGLKENKFGISFELAKDIFKQAAKMSNINLIGIDCHIGSQISELSPFQDALQKLLDLIDELTKIGIQLRHVDIGGGLGITYKDEVLPTPSQYVNAITNTVNGHDLEIIIEGAPHHYYALTKLASCYISMGRPEKAEAPLNEALRLEPNHTDAWHHRGLLYLDWGREEEAINDFEAAIRCDGSHIDARLHIAAIHHEAKRFDEASTAWSGSCRRCRAPWS